MSLPADPEGSTGLIVITGPIADGDVAALCERLRAVIATSDANVVVCDVGALPANARAIEALARLQLTARRLGRTMRLRHPSPELAELLALFGLSDVLRVEPVRQPEQREQPRGVEERVDRDDPPV